MKKAVHLIIKGRVQGVFYRASTKKEANKLGIKGWIRNLPTGEVEGFFEGEKKALDEIINFCKIGPSSAEVEEIKIEEQTPLNYKKFEAL